MKVVIIGSGNVATVFGKKMLGAGHEIIQIVGRNLERARQLASYFKAAYTTDSFEINGSADIYVIAVSDAAISSVAAEIKQPEKLLVHTGGAVSKEVLSSHSNTYGVLYPLQTLKSDPISVAPIPLLVDASDKKTLKTLTDFSMSWGDSVIAADDEARLKYHVAAVFVNNFTNHLFTLAQEFCGSNNLDFSVLQPIMQETISRGKSYSPSKMQTGPAKRKDMETIQRHEEVLKTYPELLRIYKTLTASIIHYYEK